MNPLLAHAGDAHFFSMEHVHVMLNHLPIIGLAMAILALALALMHHSRKAEIVALILVFVAAASAWPVNLTGERAYKTVRTLTDEDGAVWLDAHMDRAEKAAPAFYVLALLAAAALVVPHKWPRTTRPIAIATLVLAGACAGAGGWIALAGGAIRHPEFRTGPPPTDEQAAHQHGEEKDHHGAEKPAAQPPPAPEQTSTQPADPTRAQVEASRMQLEASRAQLEASRKLLEATPASPAQPAAAGATPPPQKPGTSPAPKTADGHQHKH
jgi:hypothetical protein